MRIEELIIEGFKSYAVRTDIKGWDPEFNAITGLNGSGKSNILDAICFVLGISNLSQVETQDEIVHRSYELYYITRVGCHEFFRSVRTTCKISYISADKLA
jgi:DNA repair exonuclease SbcCD ATPase subunit